MARDELTQNSTKQILKIPSNVKESEKNLLRAFIYNRKLYQSLIILKNLPECQMIANHVQRICKNL